MNHREQISPNTDIQAAPWWKASELDAIVDEHFTSRTALVRRRSHAEELSELTTPKVNDMKYTSTLSVC